MGRSRLRKYPEPSAVPIAKYFVVVGSALTALLLITGSSMPEPRNRFLDRPEIIDRANIRIGSDRKWPEKVVFDTSQPAFSLQSVEVVKAELSGEALHHEILEEKIVDAMTMPIGAHRQATRIKRKLGRAFPSSHVARTRNRNEQPTLSGLGGEISQQCQKLPRANVSRVRTHGWAGISRSRSEIQTVSVRITLHRLICLDLRAPEKPTVCLSRGWGAKQQFSAEQLRNDQDCFGRVRYAVNAMGARSSLPKSRIEKRSAFERAVNLRIMP